MVSIFVNGGGGTIGVPLIEQLRNLGYNEVFASKKSADKRTERFAKVMDGYKTLIVDGGSSPQEFEKFGLDVVDNVIPYFNEGNHFDVIIDCSPSHETAMLNKKNIYSTFAPNIPVMYNGGVEQSFFGRDFVAAPNCVGNTHWSEFRSERALRHVSCNTTASATILGLISEVLPPETFSHVDITYLRRFADPHEDKPLPFGLEIKVSSHHKRDVLGVFKGLNGTLETMIVKGPWRHFHGIIMDVNTTSDLGQSDIEEIKERMRKYDLCIYSEPKTQEEGLVFNMDSIIKSAYKYGFPDSDLPIPAFGLQKRCNRKFIAIGLIPQMKVVIPSECMGLDAMLGQESSFENSKQKVVNRMRFTKHGYSIKKVKANFEELLNI